MPRSVTQREAARLKKARQRERQRERARLAAEALAAEREIAAEILAPAVLRRPLMGHDGRLIRGPRIRIVNARPMRADPIGTCRDPLITTRHKAASRQLQLDWHDVGCGIGVGAVDYLRSGGAGDGAGGHDAMLEQIATRLRLDAAMTFLGAFAPYVARVALDGIPIPVWIAEIDATRADGMIRLAAGLTRLAAFYWPAVPVVRGEPVILAFGPARESYSVDVGLAA